MMGAPTILAFNLDAAALSGMSQLCAALGLRCKAVPKEGFTLPLGAMLGMPVSAPSALMVGNNFDEAMLVMCGLDEAQFNAFLDALRSAPLPRVGLKAVLTPTNVGWNACQLYDELCREREAFRRGK